MSSGEKFLRGEARSMSLLGSSDDKIGLKPTCKTSTRSLDERMLGYSEDLAKKTEFEVL